jgi:hypothetical protein
MVRRADLQAMQKFNHLAGRNAAEVSSPAAIPIEHRICRAVADEATKACGSKNVAPTNFNKKEHPVRWLRQTLGASIHALVFLAVLVSVPGVLIAKSRTVEIPENARAKNYGSGWECNRGYRAAGKRCVAVKTPANSFPTVSRYGQG